MYVQRAGIQSAVSYVMFVSYFFMSLMQFIPVGVPMPPLEFPLGDWPIY